MPGARIRVRIRARFALAIVVSAIAISAGSGNASAQSRFRAPENCGTQAEFSRELERLLGTEASLAEPQSVRIDAGEGGEYHLSIVLRDGTRELRHGDCRTLFRSAIVIAAASHEAERRRREPSAEPIAPRRVGRSWTLRLSGATGAAAGPLPGVAALFELTGGAEYHQLGLSLSARYLPGTIERKPTGHGVLVTGAGARLLATYRPWRPFRMAIGAAAYRFNGEGRGARENVTDVTYDIQPAFELATIPLRSESFELEVAVGGHFAAARPSFLITGFGEVYRVPEFGGEVLFRVVWLIP